MEMNHFFHCETCVFKTKRAKSIPLCKTELAVIFYVRSKFGNNTVFSHVLDSFPSRGSSEAAKGKIKKYSGLS